MKTLYIPVTPGGTPCFWLSAETEQEAIDNLLQDAAHMPYDGWEGFKERGYTIDTLEDPKDEGT